MLTHLQLANFKSIGHPVEIDLGEITLLYGENSSGKSSILQGLQYAREVFVHRNYDPLRTETGGRFTELGGFRTFVHGRRPERDVTLGIHCVIDRELYHPKLDEYFDLAGHSILHPGMENTLKLLADDGYYLFSERTPTPAWPLNFGVAPYTVGVSVDIGFDPPGRQLVLKQMEVYYDQRRLVRIKRIESEKAEEPGNWSVNHKIEIDCDHPVLPDYVPDLARWDRESLEITYENLGLRSSFSDSPMSPDDWESKENHLWNELLKEERDSGGSFGWKDRLKQIIGERPLDWTVGEGSNDLDNLFGESRYLPYSIFEGWFWKKVHFKQPNYPQISTDIFGRVLTEAELRDASVPTVYAGALMLQAVHAVRSELDRLRYVGPLRSHYSPPTESRTAGDARSWADGLGAWDELSNSTSHACESVNKWISSKELFGFRARLEPARELVHRISTELASRRSKVAEETNSLLAHLKASRRVLIYSPENLCLNSTDLGVGFSQVLPIIVAAQGETEGCFLLEQPELHIHAKLQAVLGDLLASGIASEPGILPDRQFVAETHSEVLLLRLMRRIRETAKELPSDGPHLQSADVSVYHVRNQDGQTAVKKMELDRFGCLTDYWPDDLFEMSYKERFGK
ncbi:AAA family ATPase [Candidatus Laterigemmans baculatus]|uniref:AAA family ATPase n=1 Tax=Candidatus Laterigemmans baculatus TaxID=2770505 RepID=UPI0013DC338E|nr:AAA family ATPase [Candidatus Laterigemmans baculatus]